jgi:hypothetical protein
MVWLMKESPVDTRHLLQGTSWADLAAPPRGFSRIDRLLRVLSPRAWITRMPWAYWLRCDSYRAARLRTSVLTRWSEPSSMPKVATTWKSSRLMGGSLSQ